MLEEYIVSLTVQRRVVEEVFSQNQNISEKFEELVNCKKFTEYKERIFLKLEAEAENQGLKLTKAIIEEIFSSIIEILKISLYVEALEDISENGKGDLAAHLFEIIDMKNVRECLQWLTTKTGASQILQVCE